MVVEQLEVEPRLVRLHEAALVALALVGQVLADGVADGAPLAVLLFLEVFIHLLPPLVGRERADEFGGVRAELPVVEGRHAEGEEGHEALVLHREVGLALRTLLLEVSIRAFRVDFVVRRLLRGAPPQHVVDQAHALGATHDVVQFRVAHFAPNSRSARAPGPAVRA